MVLLPDCDFLYNRSRRYSVSEEKDEVDCSSNLVHKFPVTTVTGYVIFFYVIRWRAGDHAILKHDEYRSHKLPYTEYLQSGVVDVQGHEVNISVSLSYANWAVGGVILRRQKVSHIVSTTGTIILFNDLFTIH